MKTSSCLLAFLVFLFAPAITWSQVEEDVASEAVETAAEQEDEGALDEVFNQVEQMNEASGTGEEFLPFIYSEKGRKDPFIKPAGLQKTTTPSPQQEEEQLATGLEGYDLASFTLTAVMWDVKYPKALVQAGENEIYSIEEGSRIGRRNGYVAKIREGEVVVVEPAVQPDKDKTVLYKTQVLKLGR